MALTDHDTTDGLVEAERIAKQLEIQLIPGIELSVNWEKQCFHIIGLNINRHYPPLKEGTASIKSLRIERAIKMGHQLEKKGFEDIYRDACHLAGNGMITRTHVARVLVERKVVSTMQKAFDLYLKRGKPGYVAAKWVDLSEGLKWITEAGGTAVLAHPRRYKITATRLRKLLTAFKENGGQGIEVVCGNSNKDDISVSARFARDFDLQGSVGSDFHTPDSPWIELGRLKAMPTDITPVWKKWI